VGPFIIRDEYGNAHEVPAGTQGAEPLPFGMAVGSDGGLYDESVPVGLGGKILGTIGIDTPNSHRANTSWTDAAKTSAANFFPGLVEGALAPFKIMGDNPDPRTMSNTDRVAVALGTFGAQGLGSALASGRGMLGKAGAKAGLADPNMRGNAASAALASGDERATAAAAFLDHNIPWDDLPDAPSRAWDFSEAVPEALEPDAPSSPFIAGTKKDGTPKTTVRGAQRQEFPGIYKRPDVIAREADARVAPESDALYDLFGVSRRDLADTARSRIGNADANVPFRSNPRGSEAAKGVMTKANRQRLVDVLGELEDTPLADGMDGWYVMDPAYQRLVDLVGPDEAKARYERFNTLTGMASPGSEVLTELNRGGHANYLAQQGRFDDFEKYGGLPGFARGHDFPKDMANIEGHPYHPTAHSGPMRRYLDTGEVNMTKGKVPAYIRASGVPETGFQTEVPVGDAHWSRAVGLADTRTKGDFGSSVSVPELQTLVPWWDSIASDVGLRPVSAQARLWGAMGPQTGVTSPVGAPKLELLSQKIAETAQRMRLSPDVVRDKVLLGELPLYSAGDERAAAPIMATVRYPEETVPSKVSGHLGGMHDPSYPEASKQAYIESLIPEGSRDPLISAMGYDPTPARAGQGAYRAGDGKMQFNPMRVYDVDGMVRPEEHEFAATAKAAVGAQDSVIPSWLTKPGVGETGVAVEGPFTTADVKRIATELGGDGGVVDGGDGTARVFRFGEGEVPYPGEPHGFSSIYNGLEDLWKTDSETPGTGYGSGAVTGEVIKAFEKLSPEMQARIDASPALRESFIQRIMTDEEASASGAGTLRDDIQNMRLRLALGGFSGLRGDLADGALLPAGGLPGTLLTSGPFSYAHREEEPE